MQIQRFEPSGPPQGQLISAPVGFKAKARDVGQVFAIGLDAGSTFDLTKSTPNIYLGATSAFGIQMSSRIPTVMTAEQKYGRPNAE
jgi:hypothetical protein